MLQLQNKGLEPYSLMDTPFTLQKNKLILSLSPVHIVSTTMHSDSSEEGKVNKQLHTHQTNQAIVFEQISIRCKTSIAST